MAAAFLVLGFGNLYGNLIVKQTSFFIASDDMTRDIHK